MFDQKGLTTLMLAAEDDNISAFKLLLDYKPHLEMLNNNKETVLIYAALKKQRECVRLLCAAGAILNAHDRQGYSALTRAIMANDLETIKILLEAGASAVCATYASHRTPLHCAAETSLAAVQLLLPYNPPLEAVSSDRETPFSLAVKKNDQAIMRCLANAGANINSIISYDHKHDSPLQYSVRSGDTELTQFLLDLGCDIQIARWANESPLRIACKAKNWHLAAMLLKAGERITSAYYYDSLLLDVLTECHEYDLLEQIVPYIDEITSFGCISTSELLRKFWPPLVKTNRSSLLKTMLDKGLHENFFNNYHEIMHMADMTSAMREVLSGYRPPSYYQLPYAKKVLFEAWLMTKKGILQSSQELYHNRAAWLFFTTSATATILGLTYAHY